jgi:Ni/Co efflux regulator RcnB
MKSLRMLLIGAALITGGSALASAQPMEHHDNRFYSDRDHDRDRDRDRDRREFRDHDRDDRRLDRDDRFRDRDDRRVYEQRRAHWDGYRWVY